MWFELYLCHCLLLRYPVLEEAMERASSTVQEISLSDEEERRVQGQIDWLMMKDGGNLPGGIPSPYFLGYIARLFQLKFQPWDYECHPRHYQPPNSPFLLALQDRLCLTDAVIQSVCCKPGHTVSILLSDVDCFYFGDACKINLGLQFYGVPYSAYTRLQKMKRNFEGYSAEERDSRLQILLFTGWDEATYFTCRGGEVFLLED